MSTAQDFRPKACGASFKNISSFASNAAESMGFKPSDNIEDVIKIFGGLVVFNPDGAQGASTISVTSEKKFTITVPAHWTPLWKRYAIAHEFAHFVLHSSCGEKPIEAKFSIGEAALERVELEAHAFACSFLVPDKELEAANLENKDDLLALSAHFWVPPSVISYRLDSKDGTE